MNSPIQKNNLPQFHFHNQNHRCDTKCSPANYLTAAGWSFNQVISWHPNNSAEHWSSHTKCIFSRLAKALSTAISLPKTALLSRPRLWEIQKMSFNLFICVAAIAVFLSINKATICISSRFYCRTIAFAICVATLSAKLLQHVQVIYFVIRCEATFSKVRPKFSSALESSAYLRLT